MGAIGVKYSVKDNAKHGSIWDLESDISGEWTLQDLQRFTKRALIEISSDVLKEEQSRGFDDRPTLVVDNKFGRKVDDVHPFGKIEYVARQSLKQILLEVWDAIDRRSPIRTGRYRGANVVLLNGQSIADSREGLISWIESNPEFRPRDKIRFLNTQPYARKLERLGISSGGGMGLSRKSPRKGQRVKSGQRSKIEMTLPNGAYALAYRAIKSKYKKNTFIAFDLISGGDINIAGVEMRGPGRVYADDRYGIRNKGRPYMYPSIIIYAVEAGLTDVGPGENK